jgi:hypothetical protein
VHPKYLASCQALITAVEDEDYYIDREPGYIHPKDHREIQRTLSDEQRANAEDRQLIREMERLKDILTE